MQKSCTERLLGSFWQKRSLFGLSEMAKINLPGCRKIEENLTEWEEWFWPCDCASAPWQSSSASRRRLCRLRTRAETTASWSDPLHDETSLYWPGTGLSYWLRSLCKLLQLCLNNLQSACLLLVWRNGFLFIPVMGTRPMTQVSIRQVVTILAPVTQ